MSESKETVMNNQTTAVEEKTPKAVRYNKKGQRRGKYAYAAPLGMVISLLCVVGIVALVFAGVSGIRQLADTTDLQEEMYYYLEPVLVYTPESFENTNIAPQDAFLNAAAYKVMLAEQVRMLREGDESSVYSVDDDGRIGVPQEEIEEAYQALFGPDAKLTHRSIEGSNLEYDDSDGTYYVPFETASTANRPVIDYVKKRASVYEVRVGYVPITDIRLDEHGKAIDPTADMATHFQTYTLTRDKKNDTYYIRSCVDK